MDGKHSKPGTSGEVFDAQWEHSATVAAAKPAPTLQQKVDDYVAGRQEIAADRDNPANG